MELLFFKRIDSPYKKTDLPIRVLREQNFKMTQKGFNINYCHIATQGTYRKIRKTETVPLIGGDLIREAFRRRLDQESKFQKSSMKVKFAEIMGISEGFGRYGR